MPCGALSPKRISENAAPMVLLYPRAPTNILGMPPRFFAPPHSQQSVIGSTSHRARMSSMVATLFLIYASSTDSHRGRVLAVRKWCRLAQAVQPATPRDRFPMRSEKSLRVIHRFELRPVLRADPVRQLACEEYRAVRYHPASARYAPRIERMASRVCLCCFAFEALGHG